jgi:hypothetical protein
MVIPSVATAERPSAVAVHVIQLQVKKRPVRGIDDMDHDSVSRLCRVDYRAESASRHSPIRGMASARYDVLKGKLVVEQRAHH